MSSLLIAVIGVGGIGSTFAFQLVRAGHAVTVVARPGSLRLRQLQGEGGIVRTTDERVDLRVAEELDEETSYDLVLVTMLAHQVDAVLPALQRCKAKCVHFMFNTFEPERLRDAVGAHRCTFGMPFVMASVDSQGRVRSQINPAQKTLHSDPRWVDLFEAAGIPSSFEAHMLLWLRCHVPVCISFESISVAAQRRGNGASWAEAMTVARGMRGGFAIIERLGYRLYPSTKSLLGILPTFAVAALLWSVSRVRSFRELLATGANECRALIDVMVGSAAHADPALRWATAALLATKPREGASSVSVVISAAPP